MSKYVLRGSVDQWIAYMEFLPIDPENGRAGDDPASYQNTRIFSCMHLAYLIWFTRPVAQIIAHFLSNNAAWSVTLTWICRCYSSMMLSIYLLLPAEYKLGSMATVKLGQLSQTWK